MEYLGLTVVFGSILFLAYFTTRFLGSKFENKAKGKYIRQVESVSLGPDRQLHLVKVSEQYMLIASSGKNIEFLSEVRVDESKCENDSESDKSKEKLQMTGFKEILERCTGKMASAKDFTDNLSRLKKIKIPGGDVLEAHEDKSRS